MLLVHFGVGFKQAKVHGAPGEIVARRGNAEETLFAGQQLFGLVQRRYAVEAFEGLAIRVVFAGVA
jgi:hypothetical protein